MTWADLEEMKMEEVMAAIAKKAQAHGDTVQELTTRDETGTDPVLRYEKADAKKALVPSCGRPMWNYATAEKLMYELESISIAPQARTKLAKFSGQKSSATSAAVHRLTYKLHQPVDKLAGRDDMLYYVTWKAGKVKLVDGKIQTSLKHFMRDGNGDLVFENERSISIFTKKYAQDKQKARVGLRAAVGMEEQVKTLKEFKFADRLQTGAWGQKEVLVGELQAPNAKFSMPHVHGYANMLNGFLLSPVHIGVGDHINTAHMGDVMGQAANLYLRSQRLAPTAPFLPWWVLVAHETNFTSFLEVSVPFVVCMHSHNPTPITLSTGETVTGHVVSLSIRQDGRECSDAICTFAPVPAYARSRL